MVVLRSVRGDGRPRVRRQRGRHGPVGRDDDRRDRLCRPADAGRAVRADRAARNARRRGGPHSGHRQQLLGGCRRAVSLESGRCRRDRDGHRQHVHPRVLAGDACRECDGRQGGLLLSQGRRGNPDRDGERPLVRGHRRRGVGLHQPATGERLFGRLFEFRAGAARPGGVCQGARHRSEDEADPAPDLGLCRDLRPQRLREIRQEPDDHVPRHRGRLRAGGRAGRRRPGRAVGNGRAERAHVVSGRHVLPRRLSPRKEFRPLYGGLHVVRDDLRTGCDRLRLQARVGVAPRGRGGPGGRC